MGVIETSIRRKNDHNLNAARNVGACDFRYVCGHVQEFFNELKNQRKAIGQDVNLTVAVLDGILVGCVKTVLHWG